MSRRHRQPERPGHPDLAPVASLYGTAPTTGGLPAWPWMPGSPLVPEVEPTVGTGDIQAKDWTGEMRVAGARRELAREIETSEVIERLRAQAAAAFLADDEPTARLLREVALKLADAVEALRR